ncbi:alanine--tRNA ligase [Coxiella endosymbiont of Ornithodoros maritimus]|uniref:alanine--tRNA ligase n=1 Tax=Coxiella endosymbiont of Ornithodoros maritimus TaxID=1656172 RepID=UPI00226545F0|nr:alanine--tRNA ligase [Coxiella endosymbiont of Ornithodoros maritimus]
MNSNQLREIFLNYFKQLDHEVVPSSSLIPKNDQTLLFTNAGMVQFKDVFLGLEIRPYQRAVSIQPCMRAGGKHNDLENVGYTARHHSFFEMLGNFSFGDYFKRDAIKFAWDFLTNVLKLPPQRLWVTVFQDDFETESIWLKEIKINPERFSRCGEKDNFWKMGNTGPCGPCTEIFYDHGPSISGGPPGSAEADGDRYVEIWNLVFMQYNRDAKGNPHPLAKQSVDTGMGLERLAAVMQGVHDNYDIDLFQYLFKALRVLLKTEDLHNTSMRVIVDHIRSVVFLIADGVIPSNEGRGYVLRRIIRRAVRHGYKLGQEEPFFYQLTKPLVEEIGGAYPLLRKSQALIEQTIKQEEIQFSNTLKKGFKILYHKMAALPSRQIPGNLIFQLYDTYGFPPDLTADIARERGFVMDYAGFDKAMERQREQSQQAHQFVANYAQKSISGETQFVGYETLNSQANVISLLQNDQPTNRLNKSEKGVVVLDRTPFYAESGGQVGDQGFLYFEKGSFRVEDTKKQGGIYLHIGEMLKGRLNVKDKVRAEVDVSRFDIMRNHSATHLLHEALRRVLGERVMQKGSLVEANRLRFDFSHAKPLMPEELQAVEKLVNQQIQENLLSTIEVMTPEEAKKKGALALFGERYGKEVRVLEMGNFSTEICGGTHTERTGEIGLFKIVSESGCAAGIRRIEAVTGKVALDYIESAEQQLRSLGALLKTNRNNLTAKLGQILEDHRKLEKELTKLKQRLANQQLESLINQVLDMHGIKTLAIRLEAVDRETLRAIVDQLKQKLGKAAIVLAMVEGKRVQLVAGVTKNCLDHFNATELLTPIAEKVGGRSGGRPDLAQGAGEKPENLEVALAAVPKWVERKLKE